MSITRIIISVLVFFSIYGGTHYYIARRLYLWLNLLFTGMNVKVFTGLFILLASSIILGFLPIPAVLARIFSFIGALWLGIFMYFILFFLAADIIIFLGKITNIIQSVTLNNVRFYSGLAVILITFSLTVYGIYNANQIKVVNYEVVFKDSSLNNLRVVLISDLHLGDVNSEKNLDKMIQTINNQNPDIVCLAGDIFNDNFNIIRYPDKAIDLFKDIKSKYGVYACLGNHDGGQTVNQMIDFLEKSNIKLLNDEYVVIDERIALFGRLDASPIGGFDGLQRQDISETIKNIGKDLPVIVMDHNPAHINEYGNEVNLLLAGHTHKGQMFPGSLMTRVIYAVDYGHYQKDENSPHVIVTSGVSTWRPPMRIGTNNEVVSILVR